MRLLISGSWVRAPRWAHPFCCVEHQAVVTSPPAQVHNSITAPWLSWLKRLSSKQEIPSSNLGGALFFRFYFYQWLNTSSQDNLDLHSNALPSELLWFVQVVLPSLFLIKVPFWQKLVNSLTDVLLFLINRETLILTLLIFIAQRQMLKYAPNKTCLPFLKFWMVQCQLQNVYSNS